jgi:hypothetical protein
VAVENDQGPQSARPKKTAAMSDPSPRTRFEGRQGDGDATIRTHQHYRSIIDWRKSTARADGMIE